MQDGEVLEVFVIYKHPLDHPHKYVARLWHVGNWPEPRPTDCFYLADTLEEARAMVPDGRVRMERSPGDQPQIVECWI